MIQRESERKKQNKLSGRPIMSLIIGLAFLSVILLVTMLETGGSNSVNKALQADTQGKSTAALTAKNLMLAVVTAIDTENKQVTLYDIERRDTVTLAYTGGSDIKDKYGKLISANQIVVGNMVDIGYDEDQNKLVTMQISTKAWEYQDVNNISINHSDRVIKIADTKYKYTDNIIVIDGEDFISVNDLTEQDELTVRGYDQTVWSITVTRGHGTVKLADYEAFLGNNITIGYEATQQITEDMTITVREGNFSLTVENGKYSATKNVTVNRNKETVVSLSDLGPDATKMSKVTFEISPFGADLYIDEELTSYANPLELAYGTHSITVSLNGYTTYQGSLMVNQAGETIKINLPESSSNAAVNVSVTGGSADGTTTEENSSDSSSETSSTDSTGTTDTVDTTASATDAPDETADDTGTATDTEDTSIDTDHLIYVQNPIGSSVYLDGKYMGTSPVSFKKAIGNHVITFIEEGYETKSYTIDVLDDGLDTYFSLPDLASANRSN